MRLLSKHFSPYHWNRHLGRTFKRTLSIADKHHFSYEYYGLVIL